MNVKRQNIAERVDAAVKESVGNEVRRTRELIGLSQENVGDLINVSTNSIKHIEHAGNVSIKTQLKCLAMLFVADALRIKHRLSNKQVKQGQHHFINQIQNMPDDELVRINNEAEDKADDAYESHMHSALKHARKHRDK